MFGGDICFLVIFMYALVEESRGYKISLISVLAISLMLDNWYLFAAAAAWCLYDLRSFIKDHDPSGDPEKNNRVESRPESDDGPITFYPYDAAIWPDDCYNSGKEFTVDSRTRYSGPRVTPNMPREGDEYISDGDHRFFTQEGYAKMQAFLNEECRRNVRRSDESAEKTGE